MGNFEKLGILVIIVLVVVILMLAVWGMGVPPDEQRAAIGLNSSTSGGDAAALPPDPRKIDLDVPAGKDPPGTDFQKWIDTPVKEDPPAEEGDAAPEPDAEPPVSPAALAHTVVKGDSFQSLARHYYGDTRLWTALRDANPGVDPTRMKIGAVLSVPHPDTVKARRASTTAPAGEPAAAGRTWTVRKGDTLSSIADKALGNKTLWKKLYDANRRKIGGDPDRLPEGLVLELP